jgi:hypothetical protein
VFAAHLNGRGHIKDHLVFFVFIFLVGDCTINKRLDLTELLLFYKAIQEQGGIVLAVIRSGTTEAILFAFWLLSQFSEVFDQVV